MVLYGRDCANCEKGSLLTLNPKFPGNSKKTRNAANHRMLVQDLLLPEPPWLPVAAIMFCPAWTVYQLPDVGKRSLQGMAKE